MNLHAKGRFFVVDMETFGLHYVDDPVLEIGISVRDLDLNELDAFHSQIWDDPWYELLKEKHQEDDTFIYKFHEESGLWNAAFEGGLPSDTVAEELLEWLDSHNVDPKKDYLVGSSVHFDSTMMFFNFPDVRERFHHRVIDVSSIKVLTEMWYPNMAARLKKEVTPAKKHRVIPDIEDTVNELRWYLENVLPEGDDSDA